MVAVLDQALLRLRLCFARSSALASVDARDRAGSAGNLLGTGALQAEAHGASRPRFYNPEVQDHAIGHRQSPFCRDYLQ